MSTLFSVLGKRDVLCIYILIFITKTHSTNRIHVLKGGGFTKIEVINKRVFRNTIYNEVINFKYNSRN